MLRILMPDGTSFLYENKEGNISERAGAAETTVASPADNISFNNIIPQNEGKSNSNFLENAVEGETSNEAYGFSSGIPQSASQTAPFRQGGLQDGLETTEPLRVGQVTKIYRPYKGPVPTQVKTDSDVQVVPKFFVETASRVVERAINSETGRIEKAKISKAYETMFDLKGGQQQVAVSRMTMNGEPYVVTMSKKAVRKVISDPNLSVEKLAVLSAVEQVIQNGAYVGSGEYEQKGNKNKLTVRYDYFETPVTIGGKDYIAAFDVEVFPDTNNYRTHKVIEKMDLIPLSDADGGPVPSANDNAPATAATGVESNPSTVIIPQNERKGNSNFLENTVGNTSSTAPGGPTSLRGEGYKAVAEILSSAYNVRFDSYDGPAGVNGYYDPESNTIYINKNSDEPVLGTIGHELIHDLKVKQPELFARLRQVVQSDLDLESFYNYRKSLLATYDALGIDYRSKTDKEIYEDVLEEAMADLGAEVLRDPETIGRIAKKDMNLAQRIVAKLEEIINTVTNAFREWFGGENGEIRGLVENFNQVKRVYQAVLEEASGKKQANAVSLDTGIKYSTKNDKNASLDNDFRSEYNTNIQKDNERILTGRGENNGGANTEALGEGRTGGGQDSIWEQSADSEKTYKRMEVVGGNAPTVLEMRRGSIDWGGRIQLYDLSSPREKKYAYGLLRKISERGIKDVDAEGRQVSKEVQDFFRNTVLKNKEGKLIPLFHATDNEFSIFEKGDFGFHLGTAEQAVAIGGKDYIAAFDVEVFPDANNYRTHKVIEKMDLIPLSDADAHPRYAANDNAPVTAATGVESNPSVNSISQTDGKSNSNFLENTVGNTSSTAQGGPTFLRGEWFGGEDGEIRGLVENFNQVKRVYQAVLEEASGKSSDVSGVQGEVRHSVETLPDGRRYVKADRQVISGDDPKVWAEQVENI